MLDAFLPLLTQDVRIIDYKYITANPYHFLDNFDNGPRFNILFASCADTPISPSLFHNMEEF